MKISLNMKRMMFCLFSAVLFFAGLNAQGLISRMPNSPYPESQIPDTLYLVNINAFSNTQQFTVVTLQGLLAKTKPRIVVERGTAALYYDLVHYGAIFDSTYAQDFTGLINHFKSNISGYLLCNLNDSTSNAAVSVCGIYNAIAVNVADTATMDSLGILQLYDLRNLGETWAWDTFQPMFSKRIVGYQDPAKCSYLSDYSIFAQAFQLFDNSNLTPMVENVFGNLKTNSALLGWGIESNIVSQSSLFGIHVHAADWAPNLSTFTNYNAPASQHTHTSDTVLRPGVHTVCFMMSDGDNVQYLLNSFASGTNWYGSPQRGLYNIGWTVSPALAELAPTALKMFYDSAANNPNGKDYFIAAPSGLGYIYPDLFRPVDSAAAISDRIMKKADMSIVNIIGNTTDLTTLAPYVQQPDIDGVFYCTYQDGYVGLNGAAMCVNNKPIISVRYTLWGGYFTPDSLAQTLNNAPKDPYSTDGYSLISVHIWDNFVDSVVKCIQALDSTVRVVTPDAFVKLFSKGMQCNPDTVSAIQATDNDLKVNLTIQPNPCSSQTQFIFTLPQSTFIDATLYDDCGKKIKTIFSGSQSAGEHNLDLDAANLPSGMYFCTLKGDYFNITRKCLVLK
jgi:hypothetical protein